MPSPADVALLAGSGLLAGAVNALAGGGSLVSFPALLAVGLPPVTANVTNTVALFPGYASSVVGGREELRGQRGRVLATAAVGVVGAVAGAVLLLTTPAGVFTAVVPFLVLLACLLLVLQSRLAAVVRRRGREQPEGRLSPVVLGAVGLGAVYGSYFGAGLGVMLLGVLGVFLAESLARVNALKNWLSFVVNTVALGAFALFGPVAWAQAAVVASTALVGGYGGARLARRVPGGLLRAAVVGYGVVVAVLLLVRD